MFKWSRLIALGLALSLILLITTCAGEDEERPTEPPSDFSTAPSTEKGPKKLSLKPTTKPDLKKPSPTPKKGPEAKGRSISGGQGGRAISNGTSTAENKNASQKCEDFDDPARTDPFPFSIKWSQFVTDMDALVLQVKNETKALSTVFSASNPVKRLF